MQGIEVKCLVIDQAGHQIRVKFISEKQVLGSKKVQYIGSTLAKFDDEFSRNREPAGSSNNNQYRKSSGGAKNTNNLISSFRQQKIKPK